MIDIHRLNNQIQLGGKGLEFKRIHITLPTELLNLISRRYPHGARSRLIALAIIERIKKFDEAELISLRRTFEKNLLDKTNWNEVTEND